MRIMIRFAALYCLPFAVAFADAGRYFAKLPLDFELNRGQASPEVKFLSRGGGYRVSLTATGAVFSIGSATVRIRVPRTEPEGVEALPGTVNYLVGRDASTWRAGIPTFRRVLYRGVYPGIDLLFYGNPRRLEFDFAVRPGADPGRISLDISGARNASIGPNGDLMIESSGGTLKFQRPRALQDGREVACRWALCGRRAGFGLGGYDRRRPLVIDPVVLPLVEHAMVLGGSSVDSAAGIVVDRAGNVYVAGTTESNDFPTTAGTLQPKHSAGECCLDAFLAKIDPTGSKLLWVAFLGGGADDRPAGLAVDDRGNVVLAGRTESFDFPLVSPLFNTGDGFVARIRADGASILWSTRIPSSAIRGVALDRESNVYLTGAVGMHAPPALPIVRPIQNFHRGATIYQTPDRGATWRMPLAGIRVWAVLADPKNPSLLYAVVELPTGRALYKTTDGGQTWNAGRGLNIQGESSAMAIDPTNPQILYVGTYKSVDGGLNFQREEGVAIAPFTEVASIAVSPRNPQVVYFGTSRGVFKSAEGGNNWSATGLMGNAARSILSLVIDPAAPETVYASTFDGLFKTTDGGATWRLLNVGAVSGLAIDPSAPRTIHAVAGNRAYRSVNGGETWVYSVLDDAHVSSIAVDPSAPARIYAAGGAGLYVSENGGQNWTPAGQQLPAFWTDPVAASFLTVNSLGAVSIAAALQTEVDAFVMKLNAEGSSIVYSTYLGGSATDEGAGIAVDANGRAYVTGTTDSLDFTLAAPVQRAKAGDTDAFLTILNADGSGLALSTYLGGSDRDAGQAVAVDGAGSAYVAGITDSVDFANPRPPRPFTAGFAARIIPGISQPIYTTRFPGVFTLPGIAVDPSGAAAVGGSIEFSPEDTCAQPGNTTDAFFARLSPAGETVLSGCVGGISNDRGHAVAVDSAGAVYLAGGTDSPDFPGFRPIETPQFRRGDAFVAKIVAAGPPSIAAVVNSANYADAIAPGSIVSVFGEGLAQSVGSFGTEVRFNGRPATLLYVSPTLINAHAPPETETGMVKVEVIRGDSIATRSVPMVQVAPAIFSSDGSGSGPGAIQHVPGYHMVSDSEPARAGEALAIYCTGLGPAEGPRPEVRIGGVAAKVLYSGPTSCCWGLYLVNIEMPEGVPPGVQPLQITIGGAASNTVTVAVHTPQQ